MSRQTRRTTRQTASSIEADPPSPQQQRQGQTQQTPSQQRHPIARRGTRRTQQSRRSASIEHVKSSGAIGYDEADEADETDAVSTHGADALSSQAQDDEIEKLPLYQIALPRLVSACDEMHTFYRTLGTSAPTSKQRMELELLRDTYKTVIRRLADNDFLDTSTSPWDGSPEWRRDLPVHPRDAAYRSNITSLLSKLVDLDDGGDEESFFEHLDDMFPAYFAAQGDPQTALKLAFRIRCHHFSTRLQESDKPVLVAASIFCKDEKYPSIAAARERIMNGPYRSFSGLDPADGSASDDVYRDFMHKFLGEVLNNTRPMQAVQSAVEKLCARGTLLEDLRFWALDQYKELLAQQSDGDDSDDSADSDHEGPPTIMKLAAPVDPGSYFDGTATFDQHAAPNTTVESTSRSPNRKRQLELQDAVRDIDMTDVLASGEAASLPGKNDDEPWQPSAADSNNDDDDEQDDHDFEERTAPADPKRRVTTARPARPVARPSIQRQAPPSSRTRAEPPAPSFSQIPSTSETTNSNLADMKQIAKQNRRMAAAKGGVRRRVAWTTHDEELLLEHIAKYGGSWTEIAGKGGFDTYRDGQSCRDKARNLKVIYLTANQRLPEKFDSVALGKKERESVLKAGYNPDRIERDVDENGRVTNTVDPRLFYDDDE